VSLGNKSGLLSTSRFQVQSESEMRDNRRWDSRRLRNNKVISCAKISVPFANVVIVAKIRVSKLP
jgi:hypothetical protein